MILVTGANGYLGRYVAALLAEGDIDYVATARTGEIVRQRAGARPFSYRVSTGIPCDLTEPLAVRALLGQAKPTRIIHCAAVVPKHPAGYSDGLAAAQSLAMVRNLAELAECPITFASSMTADYKAGGYARGKLLAEWVIAERKNPADVVIRLPGLFGAPRQSGVLYNAAIAFLTAQPFVLDAVRTTWAAMDVRDAAECMVTGEYTGPTKPMDLRLALGVVARECGLTWYDEGGLDTAFVRRVRDLVTWVRESVVKESTERTARSCMVSSGSVSTVAYTLPPPDVCAIEPTA